MPPLCDDQEYQISPCEWGSGEHNSNDSQWQAVPSPSNIPYSRQAPLYEWTENTLPPANLCKVWTDAYTPGSLLNQADHFTSVHDNLEQMLSFGILSEYDGIQSTDYSPTSTSCSETTSSLSDSSFQHDDINPSWLSQTAGHLDTLFEPWAHSAVVCVECGNRYGTYQMLEAHGRKREHLPFRCPVDRCRTAFPRRDTMLRHSASHDKLRQFSCSHCDKLFARKDHLRHHERKRHGKPEFVSKYLFKTTPVDRKANGRQPGLMNKFEATDPSDTDGSDRRSEKLRAMVASMRPFLTDTRYIEQIENRVDHLDMEPELLIRSFAEHLTGL